nr:MAG TPA: hypothetical protein [Caudoviricetes sp.]
MNRIFFIKKGLPAKVSFLNVKNEVVGRNLK